MLIDTFLPEYDVAERHKIRVSAPAPLVFAMLWTADLGTHPIVRFLLTLRALPSCFSEPVSGMRRLRSLRHSSGLTLQSFIDEGFCLLAQELDREILLGIVGKFWTVPGQIETTDPERFRGPLRRGMAQAAWNFTVEPGASGQTILKTETRVRCSDARTARQFKRYWFFVCPFSGLIRKLILQSIAQACIKAVGHSVAMDAALNTIYDTDKIK